MGEGTEDILQGECKMPWCLHAFFFFPVLVLESQSSKRWIQACWGVLMGKMFLRREYLLLPHPLCYHNKKPISCLCSSGLMPWLSCGKGSPSPLPVVLCFWELWRWFSLDTLPPLAGCAQELTSWAKVKLASMRSHFPLCTEWWCSLEMCLLHAFWFSILWGFLACCSYGKLNISLENVQAVGNKSPSRPK